MKRKHRIPRTTALLLTCFSIIGCLASHQNLQPNIQIKSTWITTTSVFSTPPVETPKPISVTLSPTPFHNPYLGPLESLTNTPIANILVYAGTTANIPSTSLAAILISIVQSRFELVDIDEYGQVIKSLDITESLVPPPETWSANSCQLMTSYWEGSRENENFLIKIQDLDHLSIHTFTFLGSAITTANIRDVLSPQMQWDALFIDSSDGSETTDEIYDLKMVSLSNGVTEPFGLLAEKTRSVSAWSQNGDYFAFGDRDEQGVPQIWMYQTQKRTKTQLTQFSSDWKDYRLGQVKFSQDSEKLAFTYEYDSKKNGDTGRTQSDFIGVINLDTKQILDMDLHTITPIFFTRSKEEIFWDAQSKILLTRINPINKQNGFTEAPIFIWMDTLTGNVIHFLNGSEIPGSEDSSSFAWLFPLTSSLDRISFFRNEYFIVYDWREMKFRAYHLLDPARKWFFRDYILPLSGPVNIASCKSLQTSP